MLSMETPQHQGIYAPLNQAISDSESEEEIHNSTKHHQIHRQKELFLQQQAHLNLKTKGRVPPNTLNLQPKSYQQNRRKLLIERQRQLERNLYKNSQFQNTDSKIIANGHKVDNMHNSGSVQNTYLRSVMMSDVGMASDGGGPCDSANNFSTFSNEYDERNQTDADNVAILGGNDCTKDIPLEPMSPARRCCFIASLLLCVLTVLVFVWVIPCSEDGSCPAPIDRVKTHNWLNNYTKIELKAGVNIVTGVRSWENNLIFLYRGDAFFPEFRPDNAKRNGIISLIGSSGAVAWYDEMEDEPVAIDCTLLDVDKNGRTDCLIIDEYGELGAINPVSGQWHWRCKERSPHKVDALDFPIILPDLDRDGVFDILMVTTSASDHQSNKHVPRKGEAANKIEPIQRNFLRILSGRNGQIIGEGFKVIECDIVRKLQLENGQTVSFNCIHNKTEAQRSKTLAELFSLITNKSLIGQKLVPASKISQHHRHYGQRKDIDSQRNIYSLNGRELIVENRGKCPEDCNVTFILSENRNGKAYTVRNFTSSGMYGMVPAQWHFKNTKPNMSGFVMKFWKWKTESPTSGQSSGSNSNPRGNETAQKTQTAKMKSKSTKSPTKDNTSKTYKQNHVHSEEDNQRSNAHQRELKHDEEYDAFDHVIHKRSSFNFDAIAPRSKRSTSISNTTNKKTAGPNLLMDNYKMQLITESVILVLFIGTETRIENTSQSNIVQFCRNDRKAVVCQPDLNNQENSMLIADLDQDGSQELVSYMSTFVQASEGSQDWRLVTYVRLLRLQSELPAFYGDVKSN
ncbi:uncharacterized protein [Musca autumnalis]|uniref:uncharacterized protein n=1 Tax=Musca autumnalis TaxID=221902 RepID=UPI003CF31DEE